MPSRKKLKGVAAGVLGAFVSRNNDLGGYWAIGKLHSLAKLSHGNTVSFDLVPRYGASQHQDINSVAASYSGILVSLLHKHEFGQGVVSSAAISLQFETSGVKFSSLPHRTDVYPFLCSLAIVDDCGKTHTASVTGWSSPHNPSVEHRSNRR